MIFVDMEKRRRLIGQLPVRSVARKKLSTKIASRNTMQKSITGKQLRNLLKNLMWTDQSISAFVVIHYFEGRGSGLVFCCYNLEY